MEGVFLVVALALSLIPIAALLFGIYAVRRLGALQRRIGSLEVEISRLARAATAAAPATFAAPSVAAPLPATLAPPTPPPPAAAPASHAPAAPPPARSTLSPSGLEQLIGGIWLQNVGSVLLLLGSFFLILWGYTQGKVGPEMLVLAGVAFGVFLAWRGDRIAQSIRPLGHALLGVGLGIVYMAIYLGHFRMHTLPDWAAFGCLSLVSFVTVDIGLRRAQSVIAALGIIGAFTPLLLASETGLGFRLPYWLMLGYLAVANAVVVVLTALRGWSGLVIVALLLSSLSWIHNASGVWTLSTQIGLSALFTALGMAPVARLVGSALPIRRVDLVVIALAPFLLLLVSLPFFITAPSTTSGALMLGLGVINLAVALWVDAKRTDRDLWRPLTAAATIFLTAALERLLAKEDLALAWCVEGAVLVWLGMAARGGWFRFLGYGVSALAGLRMLFAAGSYDPGVGTAGLGIVNGYALRDLLCIVAIVVTADRVGRRREHLSSRDRYAPGTWLVAANALGMIWLAREAGHVAHLLAPLPSAAPGARYAPIVSAPVTAAAWALQAGALFALAWLRRSAIHRHVGYGVGILAFFAYLVAIADDRAWMIRDWVAAYPTAVITLITVLTFLIAGRLVAKQQGGADAGLRRAEGRAPETAAVLANVAVLLWTARVAGQIAVRMTPGIAVESAGRDATSVLAAVFTSAGWVLQAGVLFAVGWLRRSAFYRWLGLSLVGITLLKFAFVDLQRVDVFWRFVVALGIGAALLLVSFIYQRGKRERVAT